MTNKIVVKTIVIIVFGAVFLSQNFLRGQNVAEVIPEVGQTMPSFTLMNVHNYYKKQIGNNDFKGKWLILDFWTAGCASCIKSFPKVNVIQKQFKEKLQVVLVGLQNDKQHNKRIPLIYEKFRKKYNLDLVYAFDSLLFKRWNISAVPYVIIINPMGKIKAITNSFNANQIQRLIQGEDASFKVHSSQTNQFDTRKLLLIGGNGGDDLNFKYRTVLVDAKPTDRFFQPNETRAWVTDNEPGIAKFQVSRVPLKSLYFYAYLGSGSGYGRWQIPEYPLHELFYPKPILDVQDSCLFFPDNTTGKGLYSYSLSVPSDKATSPYGVEDTYLMEIMQRDLKNYFGFEVSFEIREVTCFELTATNDGRKKLISKGGETKNFYNRYEGISYRNQPIEKLLNLYFYASPQEFPIINKTGISGNIDIDLEVDSLKDFDEINQELSKKGLNLVEGTKKMIVMVITDIEPKKQPFLNILDRISQD